MLCFVFLIYIDFGFDIQSIKINRLLNSYVVIKFYTNTPEYESMCDHKISRCTLYSKIQFESGHHETIHYKTLATNKLSIESEWNLKYVWSTNCTNLFFKIIISGWNERSKAFIRTQLGRYIYQELNLLSSSPSLSRTKWNVPDLKFI